LKALKKKDEEEDSKPVVDPHTVKIRKLNKEVTEEDLKALLSVFGEISRVKIPMDEEKNVNKGIGFVTFKTTQSASDAVKEGYVKYDFYELPVEVATQSKGRMEKQQEREQRAQRPKGERPERAERRPPPSDDNVLRRNLN
jgi:RNA recognition motif-containing protein